MGCDIHLMIEARRDGVWRNVHRRVLDAHRDTVCTSPRPEDPEAYDREYWRYSPRSRNYTLFGFIADVRRYESVFYHPVTGDEVPPLWPRRGLPDGYTPGDLNVGDDLGDHSFTWASLQELKDAPWGALYERTESIEAAAYDAWCAVGRTGEPDTVAWFLEKPYLVVDEAEYLKTPPDEWRLTTPPGTTIYVSATFRTPMLVNCDFVKFVRWLTPEVCGVKSIDDVRMLIGFDS